MTTICVGDLHGKLEIAQELLQDKEQNITFIGDFLDSFNRSRKDQLDTLVLILDAIKERDNVSALMGNHELSYLDPFYKCSGYGPTLEALLIPLKTDMRENLSIWEQQEGFLLSHAGVTNKWIPPVYKDRPLEYLENASQDDLFAVGMSRGGVYDVGGPVWCDYHWDFVPIPDIKQVFGHTATALKTEANGIRTKDGENFCIDCLDRTKEVLEINDGEATIVPL